MQEQRDVVDDEEQRRVRKNEEILKNIERARKRREEEEKKYKLVREFAGGEQEKEEEEISYGRFKNCGKGTSRHSYGSRDCRNSPPFINFNAAFNGKEEVDSGSSMDRDLRLKYPHSPPPQQSNHNHDSASPLGPTVPDDNVLAVAAVSHTEVSLPDIPTTPPPLQQRFKRLGGELLQSNKEQMQQQHSHRSGNTGDHDEHVKTSNAWGRPGPKQREYGVLFKQTDFVDEEKTPLGSHKRLLHVSDGLPMDMDRKTALDEGESSSESYSSHEKGNEPRDPRGQQRKRQKRQRPPRCIHGGLDKTVSDLAANMSGNHLQLEDERDNKHTTRRSESGATKVLRSARIPSDTTVVSFEASGEKLGGGNNSTRTVDTLSNREEGSVLDCEKLSDGFKQQQNSLPTNNPKNSKATQKIANELQKEGSVASMICTATSVAANVEAEVNAVAVDARDVALNASVGGSGWFVPRGQPSRRGRGASSAPLGSRSTSASSRRQPRSAADDYENFIDLGAVVESNEDELEAGMLRDGNSDKCGKRNSAREKGSRHNKQDLQEAVEDFIDDADEESRHKKPGRMNGNKFDTSRRSGGKGVEEVGRQISRNAITQHQPQQQQHSTSMCNIFERRQNKLPPRLAKQREQNRAIQKGQQQIHQHQQLSDPVAEFIGGADGGWGGSDSLAMVNDNSYGTASWAKYEPVVPNPMNNPSADNLANMFEQMGKGPTTSGGNADRHHPNPGATNVAQKLLAVVSVGKDGTEQGGTMGNSGGPGKHDESQRDHHVQTIIFENTNFKGGPPGNRVVTGGGIGAVSAVGNLDKTMVPAGVAVTSQQLQFAPKCSNPVFKSDAVSGGGGVQSGAGIHIAGLGYTSKSSGKQGDNIGPPDLKIDFTAFNSEMSVPPVGGAGAVATGAVASSSVATSSSGGSSGINDQQLPAKSSHTAEELNMKIASVKKVWDTHSIEDQHQNGSGGAGFSGASGFQNEGGSQDCLPKSVEQFSKVDDVTSGVSTKSRLAAEGVGVSSYPPQHPAPQQSISHMQSHQTGSSADFDHRSNQRSMVAMAAAAAAASAAVSGNSVNNTVSVHQGVQQSAVSGNSAASMAFSRLGLSALPSPPSILGNQAAAAAAAAVAAAAQQPQSIYQTAFQLDGRSAAAAAAVTNQLYPAYAAAAGMGGLAATANDIFSAAAAGGNQFRLAPQQFQQQGHQQPLVSSQPTSMMTSALKQQHSQIGPIGTKGSQGGGHFQPQQQQPQPPSGLGSGGGATGGGSGVGGGGGRGQGGLGGLPVTASSPLLIQYDAAAAAAAAGNYLPSALQRTAAAAALNAAAVGHGHHQNIQNAPPPPQGGQTAFYQALSTQHHAAAVQAAAAAVAVNQGRQQQQHQQQQNVAAAAAAAAAFASGGSGGGSGGGLHGFHPNGN